MIGRTLTTFEVSCTWQRRRSITRIPPFCRFCVVAHRKAAAGRGNPMTILVLNIFVVSQHICEACGQTITSTKDIPGPSRHQEGNKTVETLKLTYSNIYLNHDFNF